MFVERAQTASAQSLSFEDALDTLFNKILEQLRQIDLFSNLNQPVIFPVYAHDNPVAGTAHAWCVIQIIKWLEAAGCRAISDRNPILPHHAQRGDSAAIRNILSNQFCLLPQGIGDFQAAKERTHAHKVLVFCSEVLRHYCVNASARKYVETIADVYKECRGKPRDDLERQLHSTVENEARNGSAWFHHVLTEIAFLKLRSDPDSQNHGIIPVTLDGELPGYLSFIGSTDLVLKRESVSLYASDLHKTFFKILLQIYPDQNLTIKKFEDCYMTLKNRWASSSGTIARDSLNVDAVKFILQAHASIEQETQIATRHRLRDGRNDQVVEEPGEEPDDEALLKEFVDKRHKFLSTLATVPYRERKDRNPEHGEGTCNWFKSHSKFQEWQQSKGANFLWVSADPGCGKSVLAKYLVDNVLPSTEKQISCYFFFKDDFVEQRTLESALRCLLHQVFKHNPSLLDQELFASFEDDSQLLHSRTDLWETLTNVFQSKLVESFVCILDAFDECSADDRSFFMKKLHKLYMEEPVPPIKLLLTSRPYEDIARGLKKLQNKKLIIHLEGESEQEMDKISREIDIVIDKNVHDLGEDLDLEPDVTALIKKELSEVENRTYLWVALMIDMLKNAIQASKSALKSLIQQLPRSVSDAYEKIMSREQNDATNVKTRRLLHIIMAAKEPLTPGQIAVAFSMSEGGPFDEKAISRDTKFVREFSRLLIVIRSEASKASDFSILEEETMIEKTYLAHQTVREFLIMELPEPPKEALLGPFVRWAHSFHPQHSNRVLAGSCMSYLEQYDAKSHSNHMLAGSVGSYESFFEPRGANDHVFSDYAQMYWYVHLRESGDMDEITVVQSRNLCDPSSKQFWPWFGRYWRKLSSEAQPPLNFRMNPPTNITGLIVASMVGLNETVELLLHTQQDLEAKDNTHHKTAFSWACYWTHTRIACLLLDWVSKSNASIFNKIINPIDDFDVTPLHDVIGRLMFLDSDPKKEAAKGDILCLLVERGADTNLQDAEGSTPLHLAVDCGEAVMKLLLQSGADPNLKDCKGRTVLQVAVQEDYLDTARLLLKHGAESDPNLHDSDDPTPLLTAIENNSIDMTKLILDHEAHVNLERKAYNPVTQLHKITSPLISAIQRRYTEISELLLKRGANIDFTSQQWKELLLQAVRDENRDIIEIILDRGGHLNFMLNDETPLLVASRCNKREMTEFLLCRGADVNYQPSEEELLVSMSGLTAVWYPWRLGL